MRAAAPREIRFAGPDIATRSPTRRYTTCVAPREDWFLRASEIEVDQTRKVGTARNATLYFLDVPDRATRRGSSSRCPNERKSGFLTPIHRVRRGSAASRLATPYYLNLAPNYDATLVAAAA